MRQQAGRFFWHFGLTGRRKQGYKDSRLCRTVWRNQYVLAHGTRMVISGHLNPADMLACIQSEAAPDLEVSYEDGHHR
jgi:hypothetical protein